MENNPQDAHVDHAPEEEGKTMLEAVTGAFLMPWTRKPLSKAGPAKNPFGHVKKSGNKLSMKSKGGLRRKKKGVFAGWD